MASGGHDFSRVATGQPECGLWFLKSGAAYLRKPFHETVSRDSKHLHPLHDNRNLGVAFQDSTQKLVVQNDVEKRTVNLQVSGVVVDKT
jgi:hypothetical protein